MTVYSFILWCQLTNRALFYNYHSASMVMFAYESSGPSRGAYIGFCRMFKWLGIFQLVHCRVTPSIKFTDAHLYTRVKRGIVRVKCLSREHITISLAKAQIRTTWSGDDHTNHEASVPPCHGGTPILYKERLGCPSEILKITPKRYQHPVLWAWSELFFTPKKFLILK